MFLIRLNGKKKKGRFHTLFGAFRSMRRIGWSGTRWVLKDGKRPCPSLSWDDGRFAFWKKKTDKEPFAFIEQI